MKVVPLLSGILVCTALLWYVPAVAQSSSNVVWTDIPESAIPNKSSREIVPERYRTVQLRVDALQAILMQAPREHSVKASNTPTILSLPMPDGTTGDFQIDESPIMAPELAARYPEIRTYTAQGIHDRTASGRLDWTPSGFHAIIFSAHGTTYIDPYNRSTQSHYISYFKRDLVRDESRVMMEEGPLGTDSEIAAEIRRLVAAGIPRSTGEQLRTYRLAVAATGEYTIFHGGTVPAGMAAIVTAMNRVNGIYEREVAVRMVLVANNDLVVYTNPSTDPYTNNNGSTMLGQNQTTLDNVIGDANYDVGHVFSTGGGGVAFLGVPCQTGFKARGVTGLPSPIGDPFYVDYVAHEMGHQFGANHSFNGSAGSCAGGNRNPSTAYEPGSGSTIMAYAGICGAHNIQNFSDDYFHGISVDEIVAYTQLGSGSLCPVTTFTGNDPPLVDAGSTVVYTIPLGTPFVMTGSGSDPNGDTLTYCWEEFDLGPAGHPNTPSGDAPIFRTFLPTQTPTRMFPRLSDLIANTQTIGEILPSYGRILSFRLTARDNRAGGGGISHDMTSVVVAGTAGPFQVTYPNTLVAWVPSSADSVTWNVANTAGLPINCTSVDILLSTNGGQTFPITLVSNTSNDGREVISVPSNLTNLARIKVQAAGNIFFDISNTNFYITTLAAPLLVYPANNSTSQPTSLSVGWRAVLSATSYHVQVSRTSNFSLIVLNDSTVTDTSRAVGGLQTGMTYYWRVRAKNNDGISLWSSVWTFTTIALPTQVALIAPAHQATVGADSVAFRWNGQSSADRYWHEYSTDSTFAGSVIDSTVTDTSNVVYQLQINQTYWWKVKAHNSLGWGPFSVVRNFSVISTGIELTAGLPDQFKLDQNYPNPFNPSTEIRFGLPLRTHVSLEVFNTLGQHVAVLVDEEREAGYHAVTFEKPGLSSGVYLYRLVAGPYVEMRKLLLIK